MLIYDPSLDPNHYIFRLLRIVSSIEGGEIEVDKYRILDFYLLYPSALAKFRLPESSASNIKKAKKIIENKYNLINSPNFHFRKIEDFQKAAMWHLALLGFLNKEKLETGILKRADKRLAGELEERVSINKSYLDEIESFILSGALELPLLGKNGLKDRSGLMEYKYDTV
jgi:hypothetical protein